jgi:hypothetical protein
VGCQPGEKAKIPVGIGVPKRALRPNPRWVPGLLPGSLAHRPFFLGLPSWAVWTSLPVEIRRTVSRGFGWASRPISLGRENIHVGRAGAQGASTAATAARLCPAPPARGTSTLRRDESRPLRPLPIRGPYATTSLFHSVGELRTTILLLLLVRGVARSCHLFRDIEERWTGDPSGLKSVSSPAAGEWT